MTANWAVAWELDDFIFITSAHVDAFVQVVGEPIVPCHCALAVTAAVEGEGVKELWAVNVDWCDIHTWAEEDVEVFDAFWEGIADV